MKILVVNNSRKNLPKLRKSLSEHNFKVIRYEPGVSLNEKGFDLVILSGGGGEGREANDRHKDGNLWYDDEMRFLLKCKKPILGICMGFEVISAAFGRKVHKMPKDVHGLTEIRATQKGLSYIGAQRFKQNEAHEWCVKTAPKDFHVLAKSATGVEMIKHKSRLIIATQFHPEIKGGFLDLQELLRKPLAELYEL